MLERDAHRSILIVDDDPDIRDTLTQILEDEGYRIFAAANGQEALACLRQAAAPDLILLDLMMPIMNGWQFRAEQRQDALLAGIPVVVISADGTVGDKARAIDAAGYLQKPIKLDLLLDTIRHHCA